MRCTPALHAHPLHPLHPLRPLHPLTHSSTRRVCPRHPEKQITNVTWLALICSPLSFSLPFPPTIRDIPLPFPFPCQVRVHSHSRFLDTGHLRSEDESIPAAVTHVGRRGSMKENCETRKAKEKEKEKRETRGEKKRKEKASDGIILRLVRYFYPEPILESQPHRVLKPESEAAEARICIAL